MRFETEPLLEAVLAETLTPVFRANSLATTLREVRRRKRVQRWQRGTLAVLLGVGLPLAVWLRQAPTELPPPAQARSVRVVESRPLPPGMIVETRVGAVPIVASAPGGAGLVTTADQRAGVSEITDAELLALVAGRPVALVRDGGGARLVFAEPANGDASHLR